MDSDSKRTIVESVLLYVFTFFAILMGGLLLGYLISLVFKLFKINLFWNLKFYDASLLIVLLFTLIYAGIIISQKTEKAVLRQIRNYLLISFIPFGIVIYVLPSFAG